MIYIDKSTFPHCYIQEKKFDWGEPYYEMTPILIYRLIPIYLISNLQLKY